MTDFVASGAYLVPTAGSLWSLSGTRVECGEVYPRPSTQRQLAEVQALPALPGERSGQRGDPSGSPLFSEGG